MTLRDMCHVTLSSLVTCSSHSHEAMIMTTSRLKMQGKVSQNNEQKDLKIIRRVPNDKHVAFIVHNDSLLCDTCIDLLNSLK